MKTTRTKRTIKEIIENLCRRGCSYDYVMKHVDGSMSHKKFIYNEEMIKIYSVGTVYLKGKTEPYYDIDFPEMEIEQTPTYNWNDLNDDERRISRHTDHEQLKTF